MNFTRYMRLCICLLLLLTVHTSYAAPAQVVVTIKPVHSLVAAVTNGVSTPRLLLDGYSSPHSFQLKPSAVRAVYSADLVVWVDEGLENFLVGTLDGLSGSVNALRLSSIPELELLPLRAHGVHDHQHVDGDREDANHDSVARDDEMDQRYDDDKTHEGDATHIDTAASDHTPIDSHLWMNPDNAATIVGYLADTLSGLDPDNAQAYKSNATLTRKRLLQLGQKIESQLADSSDKPYLVFHDSLQYFENRFGLNSAGVIAIRPDAQPGAKRIKQVRDSIAEGSVHCLFSEPQFQLRSVEMLVRDTSVNHAEVDPLGATFESGAELYFEWMEDIANKIRECLE